MLTHLPEWGSEAGEQGSEDQEDGVGCQAGRKILIKGMLDPEFPLLAT